MHSIGYSLTVLLLAFSISAVENLSGRMKHLIECELAIPYIDVAKTGNEETSYLFVCCLCYKVVTRLPT